MVETAVDCAGAAPPAKHGAALSAAIDAQQLPHAEVHQATGASSHLPQWVANDRKVWKQEYQRPHPDWNHVQSFTQTT